MTEEKAREKVESGQIVDHSKIAITSIMRNEEANGNLKKFLGCCQELEKYNDILIMRKVLEAKVKYNEDKDCEHASFCKKARKKGFTVKINPKAYIMGELKHE